jgi:hypothetical protein
MSGEFLVSLRPPTPGVGDTAAALTKPKDSSTKAEAGDGNRFMSNDGLIWVNFIKKNLFFSKKWLIRLN